jgi:hypothetical protein
LPGAEIYYAVKANSAEEIIGALAELGANFDLASLGEAEICRGLNTPSSRLSFGNTIKRESAITVAAEEGVGLFAFDSLPEPEKLARRAPGARVFCRLLVGNKGRRGHCHANSGATRTWVQTFWLRQESGASTQSASRFTAVRSRRTRKPGAMPSLMRRGFSAPALIAQSRSAQFGRRITSALLDAGADIVAGLEDPPAVVESARSPWPLQDGDSNTQAHPRAA